MKAEIYLIIFVNILIRAGKKFYLYMQGGRVEKAKFLGESW